MIKTFKNLDKFPYPFCAGCSHSLILDKLDSALIKLNIPEHKIVMVTDIGCIGMSDQYFTTHAFHGLHGRVITYATGIKLADPSLTVMAIQGDGGMGLGGHHMINAAKKNIDITVIVCDNFNFGMTGGQHSVTTPEQAITSTTKWGNIERPLNIAGTAAINGASFVARITAFDPCLDEIILKAMQTKGFALLDIWELCTAYYTKNNSLTKTKLLEMMEQLNFKNGIIHQEDRKDYLTSYHEKYKNVLYTKTINGIKFNIKYKNNLKGKRHEVFIAGSAGQRIKSTSSIFGRAGVMSALWSTQQDDYPVTVQSGHSTSQLIFDHERIDYMGMTKPDAVIVISKDGLKKAQPYFPIMTKEDHVFIMQDLLPVETQAKIHVFDPEFLKKKIGKQYIALAAVSEYLRFSQIFPVQAFEDSVKLQREESYIDKNLNAIANSFGFLKG